MIADHDGHVTIDPFHYCESLVLVTITTNFQNTPSQR